MKQNFNRSPSRSPGQIFSFEALFHHQVVKVRSNRPTIIPDCGHVGHVTLDTRHVTLDTSHLTLDTLFLHVDVVQVGKRDC